MLALNTRAAATAPAAANISKRTHTLQLLLPLGILAALGGTAAAWRPLRGLLAGWAAAVTHRSPRLSALGAPLPTVVHRTLDHLNSGRLIIVGDVHGCNDELQALLQKLAVNPKVDNVLFAGDLVNKGPASLEVLQTVASLGPLPQHSVRGNHDEKALAARLRWEEKGKVKKNRLWVKDLDAAGGQLLHKLSTLPYTITIPSYGVMIVHAGLVPGVPLAKQKLEDLNTMRNLVPIPVDGLKASSSTAPDAPTTAGQVDAAVASSSSGVRWTALESSSDGGDAWAPHWAGPHHVFFGHDAKRGLQRTQYATSLDTGCVYGHELTAVVLPPLAELSASSPEFVAALKAKRAPTFAQLNAQLVQVKAARVYDTKFEDEN